MAESSDAQYMDWTDIYEIELKSGERTKAYMEGGYSNGNDTIFRVGNEVFSYLRNSWRLDTLVFYSSSYTYKYKPDSLDSTYIEERCFYWNKKKLAIKDIQRVIYIGQRIGSSLWPASFNEITDKDTLWMKTPVQDWCEIILYDPSIIYGYVSGVQYWFFSHSNSKEAKAFMSDLRLFGEKVSKYEIKDYGDFEDEDAVKLEEKKMDLMNKEFQDLLKKMDGLKIISVLELYD